MAKMSEESKAQIKEAVRHPVTWWKGAELPEEKIRPWEGGIQFFAEGLKGFMEGFTKIKDLLYLGKGEGKIPPNWKSVHDVAKISLVALTNPAMGVHMDRSRYGEQVHRWVMRFNATVSPLLILIQCFNLGLTPLQRIVMWTLIGMFSDFMSATNAVSEEKIWAGITPHSDQRGMMLLWRNLGGHVGGLFSGASFMLMGLKDVFGITDYQIMIWGAMIFAPLTIFSRWLPSFAKQRVDFTVKVKGEDEEGDDEKQLSFRECFSVVKHNRWFMMWTIVYFIRLVVPKTEELFLYRFLIPKMKIGGNEYGGELLYTIKGALTYLPGFLLSPLAIQAVKLFRGPVNFIRGHVIMVMLMRSTVYFVGYKTWPRLFFMFFMEMLRAVMDLWSGVPHRTVEFQMLDYVEWKTGYRSEGMTKSVDSILNKLIKNNVGAIFENAVKDWTGFRGWDVPVEQQPARFLKSIWPLLHVGVFFGEVITLIALLIYRTPQDPKVVEADLIERRALAQKLKEEVEVNA